MNSAESLVAGVESLPLGAEAATAETIAAAAAVAAEIDSSGQAMFPDRFDPVSADVIAMFAELLARPAAAQLPAALAGFHALAIVSHPGLAKCFRAPTCIGDVGESAKVGATPQHHLETHETARSRAAVAAIAAYKLEIARQLADCPGHELGDAARAYLAAVALGARLDAARRRHEEAAASEAERIADEEREAARLAAERADADREIAATKTREAYAEADRLAADERDEQRRARADALAARLLAARARAKQPERLCLRAGRAVSVDSLIASAPTLTAEDLGQYETAINAEAWTSDGPNSDLWRAS